MPGTPVRATALIHAARLLLPALERGQPIDAAVLRSAMEHAVGASDSEGGWDWKSAYDACEAAAVLFLRKFGAAMAARAGSTAALLPMLARTARLLPSHTRRSVEAEELQQFSTPVPLALVASTAAAIVPSDRVLEPSAGTGLLAIFAELAGASLVLNELAETRAGLLGLLFPDVGVTRFDAARIDDHLDPCVTPTVVLMNPPFSAKESMSFRVETRRRQPSSLACYPRARSTPHTGTSEAAMSEHGNGAIALPGALASAPQPKSLEEQVAEQLPHADAAAGIAICKRLATEPRSLGSIGIDVFGLPDSDEGRNTAKCRFYRLKVASSALATLYARAREARADMLVDELVELADAPLPAGDDPIRLKAETERRRLQIDARKWAAGKLNRLLYSDNPERAGVQVTINNDGGATALETIRERLARKREALAQERAAEDATVIGREPGDSE